MDLFFSRAKDSGPPEGLAPQMCSLTRLDLELVKRALKRHQGNKNGPQSTAD